MLVPTTAGDDQRIIFSNAGHYLTRLRLGKCRRTKIAPKPKFTSATCHLWGSVMQTIIAHTEFLGLLALNIPSHLISFSTLVINFFSFIFMLSQGLWAQQSGCLKGAMIQSLKPWGKWLVVWLTRGWGESSGRAAGGLGVSPCSGAC